MLMPYRPSPTRTRARRGFTLAEMIVAVGAVALLTIGIGQIFQSVGSLVGTGAALAETDQLARALEAQMREDFAALNRMRATDTFLLLRNREVEGIYLSSEDRDADRRAGLAPMSPDDDPDDVSRAIDTRVDEICFLAFGPGNSGLYKSAQVSDPRPGYTTPSAPIAMIYYGHGLRPEPARGFDPDDPGSDANVPDRIWVPDGDFGQPAGQSNRFDGSRRVTGRNEFASEWPLLRQSVVFVGPNLAGPKGTTVGAGFDPVLTYTPLIRARETASRAPQFWSGVTDDDDDGWPGNSGGLYDDRPKPRFLPFGRTDLCAQSPDDVKRWLEGYPLPPSGAGPIPPLFDATPFRTGLFDDRNVTLNTGELNNNDDAPDALLWLRTSTNANASLAAKNNANILNRARYQSALAGLLTRRQAESDPPIIDRFDTLTVGAGSASGVIPSGDLPATALMDLHATLGTRCSRFAVSWSDGTTWPENEPEFVEDSDDDGVIDIIYRPGDIVWFDIDLPKHDPNDTDDFEDLVKTIPSPQVAFHNPEITPEELDTQGAGARLFTTDEPGAYTIANDGEYPESLYTGAAPDFDRGDEYLGVWGYRLLDENGTGEFTEFAWPKPKLIRIRATFHDDQLRLTEGRTYEFIFAINLAL